MKIFKVLKVTFFTSLFIAILVTLVSICFGFLENNMINFEIENFTEIQFTGSIEKLICIVFFLMWIFSFVGLNLAIWPIYVSKLIVFIKDIVNKKIVDTNTSIYTRDLPLYNSAIAGELIDLKTKNDEEYIAGVIELINKGYIIEKENEIIVDKTKSTDGLLKNEKFILSTCENINFISFKINPYTFYEKIKEDMYDLNLYNKNTFLKKIINRIIFYIKNNNDKENDINTLIIGYVVLFTFVFILVNLFENFIITITILAIIYVLILNFLRNNKLTANGELEKEKMLKLKRFLERESNFKNKGEEERELWGRYSAFAVAFGLNEEMKNEIYNKIIKKS